MIFLVSSPVYSGVERYYCTVSPYSHHQRVGSKRLALLQGHRKVWQCGSVPSQPLSDSCVKRHVDPALTMIHRDKANTGACLRLQERERSGPSRRICGRLRFSASKADAPRMYGVFHFESQSRERREHGRPVQTDSSMILPSHSRLKRRQGKLDFLDLSRLISDHVRGCNSGRPWLQTKHQRRGDFDVMIAELLHARTRSSTSERPRMSYGRVLRSKEDTKRCRRHRSPCGPGYGPLRMVPSAEMRVVLEHVLLVAGSDLSIQVCLTASGKQARDC